MPIRICRMKYACACMCVCPFAALFSIYFAKEKNVWCLKMWATEFLLSLSLSYTLLRIEMCICDCITLTRSHFFPNLKLIVSRNGINLFIYFFVYFESFVSSFFFFSSFLSFGWFFLWRICWWNFSYIIFKMYPLPNLRMQKKLAIWILNFFGLPFMQPFPKI